MLVLAPAACCLAGLALHQLLLTLMRSLNAHAPAGAAADAPTPAKEAAARKPSKAGKVRTLSALSAPRKPSVAGKVHTLNALTAPRKPSKVWQGAPLRVICKCFRILGQANVDCRSTLLLQWHISFF